MEGGAVRIERKGPSHDAMSTAYWTERALFGAAFVFGVWALLTAAQAGFFASLPVPAAPARAAALPGDAGAPGNLTSGSAWSHAAVAPGSWVARLDAPSVGLVATVIEGSTDDMLAKAAGHIEHTAFPGEGGNIGIAGHRDTTFRAVRHLKSGDLVHLTTTSGTFEYRIERTFIVDPRDVYVLDPTDTPSLTLVTCYPFTFIGHAPKRYIVHASLTKGP